MSIRSCFVPRGQHVGGSGHAHNPLYQNLTKIMTQSQPQLSLSQPFLASAAGQAYIPLGGGRGPAATTRGMSSSADKLPAGGFAQSTMSLSFHQQVKNSAHRLPAVVVGGGGRKLLHSIKANQGDGGDEYDNMQVGNELLCRESTNDLCKICFPL